MICPKWQWRRETNNKCAVIIVIPSTDKRIASLALTEYHADPTPIAKAILTCNNVYSRASRVGRAKIASWRHHATRNLLVPGFGTKADALLSQTRDDWCIATNQFAVRPSRMAKIERGDAIEYLLHAPTNLVGVGRVVCLPLGRCLLPAKCLPIWGLTPQTIYMGIREMFC